MSDARPRQDDEARRVMVCPSCGRVSSVAWWITRPICVHSWNNGTPEIWDGDNTDGEGQAIEQAQNVAYRTPGPSTWTEVESAQTVVEQVSLAELHDGDVVWDDDGFWPIREVGSYPEYVGFTVYASARPRRRTGAHRNAILREVS